MQESAGGRANPTSTEEYSSSYIKTFGRYVGEKVQVRAGVTEWPVVGTVIGADDLGIVLTLSNGCERMIPWSAITSVRVGRS